MRRGPSYRGVVSKITFRADDELVERLEAHDASKSEVMRAALRAYLDDAERGRRHRDGPGPDRPRREDAGDDERRHTEPGGRHRGDAKLTELFDRLLERRLRTLLAVTPEPPAEARGRRPSTTRREPSVVVNVGERGVGVSDDPVRRETTPTPEGRGMSDTPWEGVSDADRGTVSDTVDERVSDTDEPGGVGRESRSCGRCGTELSDDHVYCPNCGEKAARRLFCDCGDEVRSDWSFCPGCGRRTPAADVLDETEGVGRQ